MRIKLADFVIEINNKFEFLENQCKAYITDDTRVDFLVECSEQEIEAERKIFEEPVLDGYLESLAVYRKICTQIIEHDAFLVHSAVIEVDGNAYAFLARSGTGKSTHIALWRRAFGERVQIINGDKPIYRFIDGEIYAYGTPWCGKEGWNRNTRAPIKALCYIQRAKENSVEKITPTDAVMRLVNQVFIPRTDNGSLKTLELIDRLLNRVDSYIVNCNISNEAALVAYNAIVESEERK